MRRREKNCPEGVDGLRRRLGLCRRTVAAVPARCLMLACAPRGCLGSCVPAPGHVGQPQVSAHADVRLQFGDVHGPVDVRGREDAGKAGRFHTFVDVGAVRRHAARRPPHHGRFDEAHLLGRRARHRAAAHVQQGCIADARRPRWHVLIVARQRPLAGLVGVVCVAGA